MEDKNTNINEEAWVVIPGFSKYRINTVTREVQSQARSRGKEWRPIKSNSTASNAHFRILSDKGRGLAITPARLAYCALHNINPLRLDSNMYVTERDGILRLCDSREFSQMKLKNRKPRTEEHIKGEYKKARRVIDLILGAYETGDYTPIVTEIWSYENKIKAYLINRGMAFNSDKIQEIWMQVFDITIDAIRKRKAYIVNVYGYLRRVAITIVANERKIRERVNSLEALASTSRALRAEADY